MKLSTKGSVALKKISIRKYFLFSRLAIMVIEPSTMRGGMTDGVLFFNEIVRLILSTQSGG